MYAPLPVNGQHLNYSISSIPKFNVIWDYNRPTHIPAPSRLSRPLFVDMVNEPSEPVRYQIIDGGSQRGSDLLTGTLHGLHIYRAAGSPCMALFRPRTWSHLSCYGPEER